MFKKFRSSQAVVPVEIPVPNPPFLQLQKQRFEDLQVKSDATRLPALQSRAGSGVIAEVSRDQLTGEFLRREVAGSGAAIVRNFLDPDTAAQLSQDLEHALSVLARVGSDGNSGDGWYQAFVTDGSPTLPYCRRIATLGQMGALLVDSPNLAQRYLELMNQLGVVLAIEEYLGAPAILSAEKSVIRRVPPDTGTNWHQDGAFLGQEVRALNLWIALSDCGKDAPGLDLVPARPDGILPTGTDGALFEWSVGDGAVDAWRGDLPIVHPDFQAGDAVFFDHLNVHRTGVRPGMTQSRYAIECWFFSPWHFPQDYQGLMANIGATT